MKSSPNSISWNIQSLKLKRQDKNILQSIKGNVKSGSFYSIMGPSGAGKSSLLSILTCRIQKKHRQYILDGQIFLNEQQLTLEKFGKFAAFVRQDDILLSTLSVYQTFQFQANLKLSHLQKNDRKRIIDQRIFQLNLQQCKNSLVGGQFIKSISGGQRKRVCIGIQLLANPMCLIMDEPTSGLDSYTSLKLIKMIKNLCKIQNKIVIATIHQPSSLIFSQMDQLLLLKKGQVVYEGNAQQIVPYMEQNGIKVDHRMNPADFFMLQISDYKKNQQNYSSKMTNQTYIKYLQSQKGRRQIQYINPNTDKNSLSNSRLSVVNQIYQSSESSWPHQFVMLLPRNLKNIIRSPGNQLSKLLDIFFCSILVGMLYFDIGNRVPDDSDMQQIISFVQEHRAFNFMILFNLFGMGLYQTVLFFPPQKQICLKETSSNLYSISAYYFARLFVQLPGLIIPQMIIGTIVYFCAGLEITFMHYLIFSGGLALAGLSGYMMGSFLGVAFSKGSTAVQMVTLVSLPVILFGGMIIDVRTVPQYARWMQYISPIRFTYQILIQDQCDMNKFYDYGHNEFIRNGLGIQRQVGYWYLYCGILLGFMGLLSLSFLYISKKAI